MIRRRRPVLRAATMAGGAAIAYHAGKTSGANASQGYAQPAEDAGVQEVAPAPPAPVSTAGGPSEDAIAKLKELGQLRDQGILTDQEFEAQKHKVLGG
jgi:putative oligomerization/nucleic acid binding protein